MPITTHSLTRDRFTWLMYLMMGFYSYFLSGLGPAMPFLRAELRLSYTVSSLHFSAFAAGILVAGLITDRLTRRFGRRKIFWSGMAGMIAGALLLLLGSRPALTIGGSLMMGTIGSFLLVLIPSLLSERFGEARAVAISEANVAGSFCAGLAPLAIGLLVRIHWGWRSAFLLIVAGGFLLYGMSRQVDFPEVSAEHSTQARASTRLPAIFWAYWILIVLAVAVEFCIIFWSATFLEVERQLPKANAALVMSVFLGAMVVGRFLGSHVSQHFRSERIVLGSVGMSLIGFLLHWGAIPVALTMSGLFLAGIGVSNLYPQLLALAVGTAPQQTDAASARASLASGIAILCLPLLLGGLADAVGIGRAYGMVLVLLALVAIGMLIVRNLIQQRHLKNE